MPPDSCLSGNLHPDHSILTMTAETWPLSHSSEPCLPIPFPHCYLFVPLSGQLSFLYPHLLLSSPSRTKVENQLPPPYLPSFLSLPPTAPPYPLMPQVIPWSLSTHRPTLPHSPLWSLLIPPLSQLLLSSTRSKRWLEPRIVHVHNPFSLQDLTQRSGWVPSLLVVLFLSRSFVIKPMI